MVKYWHFCLLSATSCLLLSTDNLDATVLSSIPSESSKHHSHIHTLSHLDLSHFSPNLFLKQSGYQSYRMASVCFITDAGNCSGQEFGNLETPDGTNRPDYDTIPEQCRDAGYTKTSCPAGQHLVNPCPSDNRYYERCECNENLTEICNIPYYGVGPSCDGKYEKCERDDDRACKEEGYPLTGSCPTLQVPNRRCPYDSNYYDKCVCQSGLISCPSPQIGVGPSCGGKYQSCQCPSNYKSCDCGPAVGASSCTINGKTTYSDCKACCDDTCPSGYSKSYPGGCYDTSRTDCGNTCYKAKDCCDDTCPSGYSKTKSSECYDTSSTGCGNTCYKAKECEPQCDDTCPSGYSKTNPGGCYDTRTTGCGNTCYKSKSCCSSSYRFTCTGTYESPGSASCDGKYSVCNCSDGVWTGSKCQVTASAQIYVSSVSCVKNASVYNVRVTQRNSPKKCSLCPSKSLTGSAYNKVIVQFNPNNVGGDAIANQKCLDYVNNFTPTWLSGYSCYDTECD